MSLLFDHLVLKVNNLSRAIETFSQAGFTVTKGGIHKGGYSENALIFFKDGSFIELLAMKEGLKPFLLRLYSRTRGFMRLKYSRKWGLFHRFYDRALTLPEGLTDFCLLTPDLKQELERIDMEGLFVTKPMNASRKKPDGTVVRWQMASTLLTELPFLKGPYSPKSAPSAEQSSHANGIEGVKSVTMLALDFKEMVRNLSILLNQNARYAEQSRDTAASFDLGTTELLVKKSSEHDSLVKKFRGNGLGVFGIEWRLAPGNDTPDSDLHGLVVADRKEKVVV